MKYVEFVYSLPLPAGAGNFSRRRVQNGSGGPPNLLNNRYQGLFPWGYSRPLTSIYCQDQERVELYIHTPNTPSWRGAQLKIKHRDIFTFAKKWKKGHSTVR